MTQLLTSVIITLNGNEMIGTFTIQEINFDKSFLFKRVDGSLLKISLEKASEKLKNSGDFQRHVYKVSPSGYGIH